MGHLRQIPWCSFFAFFVTKKTASGPMWHDLMSWLGERRSEWSVVDFWAATSIFEPQPVFLSSDRYLFVNILPPHLFPISGVVLLQLDAGLNFSDTKVVICNFEPTAASIKNWSLSQSPSLWRWTRIPSGIWGLIEITLWKIETCYNVYDFIQ